MGLLNELFTNVYFWTLWVINELQDPRDHKEPREIVEPSECLDSQEMTEETDGPESLDHQEPLDGMVATELTELQESQDDRDHQECQVSCILFKRLSWGVISTRRQVLCEKQKAWHFISARGQPEQSLALRIEKQFVGLKRRAKPLSLHQQLFFAAPRFSESSAEIPSS